MDLVGWLILWTLQALILGVWADHWKDRQLALWMLIGFVLPLGGYVMLYAIPLERVKREKRSSDEPTDYMTL